MFNLVFHPPQRDYITTSVEAQDGYSSLFTSFIPSSSLPIGRIADEDTMVKLDARGYIAIAEIVLYVPIFFIGIPIAFRNGFTRKAGWIFLVLLSIGASTELPKQASNDALTTF